MLNSFTKMQALQMALVGFFCFIVPVMWYGDLPLAQAVGAGMVMSVPFAGVQWVTITVMSRFMSPQGDNIKGLTR